MDSYRAKTFYCESIALNYNKERFGSLKGRIYSFFEKLAIKRALRYKKELKCVSKKFSLLDIPCGTGRITKYIYDLGYEVMGADISDDMLDIARRNKEITFIKEDIEKTNFADKYFYTVVCVRLMGHLPYQVKIKVLKELKRISNYQIVTFYLTKKNLHHWYPLSKKELMKLLKKCNLTPITYFYTFPFWSDGVTYLLHG